MTRWRDRVIAGAIFVTDGLVATIAGGFTLLLIVAVFSRYVFDQALVTGVELTRIAFVWACFLAAANGIARQAHIRVIVLRDIAGSRMKQGVEIFVWLAILGFAAAMVWHGATLFHKVRPTFFPALQVSQAWMYAALPTAGLLMVFHALLALTGATPPPDRTDDDVVEAIT